MMKYNPKIHHRRSIRLKGYDYSRAGAYFITICCQDRKCRFGEIENDEMILNKYGIIAYDEWVKLPARFPNFELDVFQIMPNHMHGIIVLTEPVTNGVIMAGITPAPNDVTNKNAGAGFTPAQNAPKDIDNKNAKIENVATGINATEKQSQPKQKDNRVRVNRTPTTNATVGDIVGAYKSLVANACLEIFKSKNEMMGKLWQRNYHENIIRDEQSYQRISNYIINNPANWNDDKFFMK